MNRFVVFSTLFITLLFVMTPVSAATFQQAEIQASLLDSAKDWYNEHKLALMGAGMIVVGTLLVMTGVGAGAGGYMILAGSALVVGDVVYNDYVKDDGSSESGAVFTQSYNINDTPETAVYDTYTPVDSNVVDQEAQSDINTLMNKISPSFTTYELLRAGDNQFQSAVLIAPDRLYGPVVFPATFIFQAAGNTEVQQTNVLTSIVFEVIDAQGNTVDKIALTGSFSATPGEVLTFTEILKAPDAHMDKINSLLAGHVEASWLDELTQSPAIQPYYVRVRLYGVAQNYYWDDSQSTWVLDSQVPFSITFSADKMDAHEQAGFYVFTGFNTVMPAALQTDPRAYSFYAYQVSEYGAMGNAVVRVWGQGIALYNQNWAYRAYVQANTPLYAPVSGITVIDEARVVVLRRYDDGHVDIAALQPLDGVVSLGDLIAYAKKVEGNVYLSKAETETGVANYDVLIAVKGHVIYNSTTKDFWLLAKPAVYVQDGVLVLNSQVFSQIAPLVEDGTIDESERSVINSNIDAVIAGLQSKISAASALKDQAERYSNTSAAFYAEKAIEYYSSAINVLEQAKSGDVSVVQNNLVQARLYEEAGDQAMKAAQLALSGQYDEAAAIFDGAQELVKQAEAALPVGGYSVSGIIDWLKAHWWLIILIIIAIIIIRIVLG